MRSRRSQLLRSSRRGFTLLELLLATAVAAIVLLVINATFFGALRLHNTTHEKVDNDLALQRALGIIRRDLAGLMLPTTVPATGGNVLAGDLTTDTGSTATPNDPPGDRVSPDFYTNSASIDGWNPFSEVQKVSYFLTPTTGSNTKTLVRAITRNILSAQPDQGPDEQQQLLTGVAAVDVFFYDGTDWVSDWDSLTTSSLPTAIKFRVAMARPGSEGNTVPDAAGPVELVVPVIVTTTTSAQQAAADAAATP